MIMTKSIGRQAQIDMCFQHGPQLTLKNKAYSDSVDGLLHWMLASDRVDHDITSSTLRLQRKTTAVVFTRQAGIIAGLEEACYLLGKYPAISVQPQVQDGQAVDQNTTLLSFSAEVTDVLRLERTVLNLIGRMSGIATQTNALQQVAADNPHRPRIAGTRKTPWMALDKKAVYCGGGLTHRLNLSDSVLIKDNHLSSLQQQTVDFNWAVAIQQAIQRVAEAGLPFFELEVENFAQANTAIATFEHIDSDRRMTMVLMLDNIKPAEAQTFIVGVQNNEIYEHILIEASGDITHETLPLWVEAGVDVVSLGALTHSAKNFNISMSLT